MPGEELYAEYGKNYWLDHLPSLSPEARRHCIQKYKYKASELLKSGLRSDGSRPSAAPSIVSFLRASLPAPPMHSLFLHEDTISAPSTVRLHFSQPSTPRLAYDPSLLLLEKRSLLRDYFLKEPVLQLHIQEPADLYNVCAPDSSCAIQLALLYQCLDQVDWTAEFSSHDSSHPFFRYRRRGPHSPIDHSHVLRLVRSLMNIRTDPGTHVRASLEAWHHGLLNNLRSPILKAPQLLDIDEVLQSLPEQVSASIFVKLPYAPLDTVQHRSWSAL